MDKDKKELTQEAESYNKAFEELEKLVSEETLKENADNFAAFRKFVADVKAALPKIKANEDVEGAIKDFNEAAGEEEYNISEEMTLEDWFDKEDLEAIDESLKKETKISEIKEMEVFNKVLDAMVPVLEAGIDEQYAESADRIEGKLAAAKEALEKVEDGVFFRPYRRKMLT